MNQGPNNKKAMFNTRLRAARELRGWSQRELASQLNISELTVGRWERGERFPQLVYRARLCELFNMTAQELGLAEPTQEPLPEIAPSFNPALEEISPVSQPSASEDPVRMFQPLTPEKERLPQVASQVGSKKRNRGRFLEKRKVIIVGMLVLLLGSIGVTGTGWFLRPLSSLFSHTTLPTHTTLGIPLRGSSLSDPATTPFLNDSLSGPDPQQYWHNGDDCRFVHKAYQIDESGVNYCLLWGFPSVRDLEYQISLKILRGNQAGIVFRANDPSQLYYFSLDTSGHYGLYLIDQPTQQKKTLLATFSSAIVQGNGRVNQLAVLAQGNTLTLYINRQYVNQVKDTTLNKGQIGICVGSYDDPGTGLFTVAYQNAKVWDLDPND